MRGKSFNKKPTDTYRIFILGDSYAFGFGVKETETFGAYLEQCLPAKLNKKIDIINGGVPGYGTIDQLNFLKLYGKDVNPDLIILQFLSVNDFRENHYPAVEWADVEDGWLTAKPGYFENDTTESFSISIVIDWLKSNLHSAKFISERIGYLSMKSGFFGKLESFWGEDFSKDDEKKTIEAIDKLLNYSKQLNSDFLLLYTVGQGHVLSEKQDELPSEKFIKRIAREENIKWINTLRGMRKSPNKNELYFPIDGHWTAEGHREIAEMICNSLIP